MPQYAMEGRDDVIRQLDTFTTAYVEVAFWTSEAPGVTTEEWQATDDHDGGSIPCDVSFTDLADKTLATIKADCEAFQASRAWLDYMEECSDADEVQAGHDFWLTRNGHGTGFWDRNLPEPHGNTLTEAANGFGEQYLYLGDDGQVYV